MRIVLGAIGLTAMVAAGASLLLALPPGFPDGYISPYDQATQVWVTVGTYALLLAGIFTLAAAAFNKPRRGVVGAIIAVLLYGSVTLVDACPGLPWCANSVLHLTGTLIDDGAGG